MEKFKTLVVATLALSLVMVAITGGCAPVETSGLKVVTSTSLLTQIVEQVGGNMVEATTIVPPGQHPGDFDAKPGDIQKLADAELFLWHNWPGEVFVPGLIDSADNPKMIVVKVDIKGNWMTPAVQLKATDKVAAALSQVDGKNSATYQRLAAEYKDRIVAKEAEIKARLDKADFSDMNVISAFWQAGFIEWAGLSVVATYGDPDSLTPKVVKELIDKGREAKVILIVDNLQSGADAGTAIAEELGAQRIILSNFPGGFDNTETWEKAIDRNIELILEAIPR